MIVRSVLLGLVAFSLSCVGASTPSDAPDGGVAAGSGPGATRQKIEAARNLTHFAREIDGALDARGNTLERVAQGFASAAYRNADSHDLSRMGALLPLDAAGTFRFGPARVDRWSLSAKLAGTNGGDGVLDDGRVVYADAYPSTDVLAIAGDRHAELFYLLRDESAPKTFELDLALGSDLKLRRDPLPDGAIEWLDKKGDAALRVDPAFAIDAKGARRPVPMRIDNGKLTLALDATGLSYPILIDPLISVPVWQYITSGPWYARNGVGLAYTTGGVVMFNGTYDYWGGGHIAESWIWNGSSWTALAASGAPAMGSAAATTWKGNALFHGGCNGTVCGTTTATTNVAFTYNGSSWSPFCGGSAVACGMSPRQGHSLAVVNNQLVMFGGTTRGPSPSYTFAPNNEVWTLESTAGSNAFTAVTPPSVTKPGARAYHAMVGSDDHSVAVLFGGFGGVNTFGDTWFWKKTGTNAGTWECVCNCYFSASEARTCTGPAPRYGHGLTYDSYRKKFILFGGFTDLGGGSASSGDTWEFDPTTKQWTPLCGVSGTPSCGSGMLNDDGKIAFDPVRKRVVQAAGFSSGYRNYTFELYVRGGDCTTNADCDTGYCVNGSCCTTSSCPTCQTCGSATNPGVCTNITPAGSPDTAKGCAACDGAGACKKALGVACSAASECALGNCVDGVCCATSSCGAGKQCAPLVSGVSGAGTCKSIVGQTCAAPTDCVNNQCVDGVCCGASSCAAGSKCNYPGALGTCKKDQGQACTVGTECGSTFCTDGYCCNQACTGQCQACDNVKGTCTAVVGAPHTNAVTTRTACSGTGDCKAQCNGSDPLACRYPGSSLSCGTPSCSGGVETSLGKCDGAGSCSAASKSCGAYVCKGVACATTCASDADCASGNYCKAGVCSPKDVDGTACSVATSCASGSCVDGVCCATSSCSGGARCNVLGAVGRCSKPRGVACTSSSECGGGFCVDGVCCDTACTGQCQACDATGSVGTCTTITGAPHGTRTACSGTGAGTTCGPRCDGTSATTCKYPTSSTSCGAATCSAGTETHVAGCNGAGSCADTPKSCGAYACGVGTCKTGCTVKEDCAAGYYCRSGACTLMEGLGTACTSTTECGGGTCVDGVCCGVTSCGAGRSCSAGPVKGVCSSLAGTACTSNSECASGACVDGVCCDSACNGPCEACNQVGSVGKCVPIVGQPLVGHPACSTTPTDPTCGLRCTGTDGKACYNASMSTSCGTASCAAGIETQVSTCNGSGACKVVTKSCGAYGCGTSACLIACVTNADCATGHFCKDGACVGRQELGEKCADAAQCKSNFCTDGVCCSVTSCGEGSSCASGPGPQAGTCLKRNGVTCTGASDCASGHCVDGLCCDGACSGQCEACDLAGSEGKCTPVTGKPHGARSACDSLPDTDCAKASCDGTVRDKCNAYANGATTVCGMNSCTADRKFQKSGTCDGKGGCAMPDPRPCTPYACDATASSGCKTACTADTDCAEGFTCTEGACVQGAKCSEDRTQSIDKTGAATDCKPYRCGSDGTCLKACASSDDCVSGTACDPATKACVGVAAETGDDGGCTSSRGRAQGSTAAWLLALIGVTRLRRRAR